MQQIPVLGGIRPRDVDKIHQIACAIQQISRYTPTNLLFVTNRCVLAEYSVQLRELFSHL